MKIDKRKFYIAVANTRKDMVNILANAGVSAHVVTAIKNGNDVLPQTVGKLAKALDVDAAEIAE